MKLWPFKTETAKSLAGTVAELPLNLASTDDDADTRYARWRSRDPFPEIAPALLNSADLQDYVAATGMIHPFIASDAHLKPASYGVPLAGEVLYWEERFDEASGAMVREEKSFEFKKGQHLKLTRNSIVYVTLEPTLRLPDYIAARFNLTIFEIYRGLLVGTGPLVDPGFVGQIHLPLHNYTANDYTIVAGEPFVWMEFTKLSANGRWHKHVDDPPNRDGTYRPFPPRKRERRVIKDYLKDNEDVTSSIPRLVAQARESARSAADDAKRGRNISILTGIVVLVGIAAMLASVWIGFEDGDRERDELRRELNELRLQVDPQPASSPRPTASPTRERP